jgi:ribose transport system permease protein
MRQTSITTLLRNRVFTLGLTIALLCVAATMIWPDKFPTFGNLSQVLLNLSIEAIVAVGMMILLISGAFDLSVGSVVAFSGGLAAYLMYYHGVYVPVAVLAGLGGAVLIGLINGWLIAYIGINPLIQTLAMMGVVRGLALMLSGAGIQNLPPSFEALGQSRFWGLQSPVWAMILVAVVFSFLVANSVFFRRYYYIGGNEQAAFLSGIRVKRMRVFSFALSAGLAGLAGILLSARLGAALATLGQGLELRVITAVILGGASLLGGQGSIAGAVLGALFMGLVSNVMIIARVSGYWQEIVLGLILIAAVSIDLLLQRQAGGVLKSLLKNKTTEV